MRQSSRMKRVVVEKTQDGAALAFAWLGVFLLASDILEKRANTGIFHPQNKAKDW